MRKMKHADNQINLGDSLTTLTFATYNFLVFWNFEFKNLSGIHKFI